jgi:hypothetical protein
MACVWPLWRCCILAGVQAHLTRNAAKELEAPSPLQVGIHALAATGTGRHCFVAASGTDRLWLSKPVLRSLDLAETATRSLSPPVKLEGGGL